MSAEAFKSGSLGDLAVLYVRRIALQERAEALSWLRVNVNEHRAALGLPSREEEDRERAIESFQRGVVTIREAFEEFGVAMRRAGDQAAMLRRKIEREMMDP